MVVEKEKRASPQSARLRRTTFLTERLVFNFFLTFCFTCSIASLYLFFLAFSPLFFSYLLPLYFLLSSFFLLIISYFFQYLFVMCSATSCGYMIPFEDIFLRLSEASNSRNRYTTYFFKCWSFKLSSSFS